MQNEIYAPDEFARCFHLRGYGTREQARKWMSCQGRDSFVEEDFEKCWRAIEQNPITPRQAKYIALNDDDVNPASPQNAPNSRGEDFSRTLRREQQRTDALNVRIKQRWEEEHDG